MKVILLRSEDEIIDLRGSDLGSSLQVQKSCLSVFVSL